jgi:hypothetical protein
MWRKLRIFILLFILATVAQNAWLQARDLDWKDSLYVAVYPINVDGSATTASYLSMLNQEQFDPIAEYLAEEAERYGLSGKQPFKLRLGSIVNNRPPQPVKNATMLQTMLWSLQFRYWAWHHSPEIRVPPHIRLYLLFHDPAQYKTLPHSAALNKGRIGLVNVFAERDYEKQNAVVIAHELLHTVGATDKYDLATTLPLFPVGFANPEKQPVYPQDFAELMAGRLPVSATRADIPSGLSQTLIGSLTAREIGWIKAPR